MTNDTHSKYKTSTIVLAILVTLLSSYIIFDKAQAYHTAKQQQELELQQRALDILGFLEYHNGTFSISPNLKAEAQKNFINSTRTFPIALGYVYDLNNSQVVWRTDQDMSISDYRVYDLNELNRQLFSNVEFNEFRKLDNPEKMIVLDDTMSDGVGNYRLAIQFFTYKNLTKTENYVFVTALAT